MQVVVNSLLTNYQQSGRGKVILLLHGWGDSLNTFQQLLQSFSKKYQVISMDLPGFGKTQPPHEVWNLDNYAQFTADFLNKVGVSDLYTIVGHSNGGALAIRGVSQGVLKPEKIVLLAASGIRDRQNLKRLGLKAIAKVGKLVASVLPRGMRRTLRAKFYGVVGSDVLVVENLQETFKRTVAQDVQKDAKNLHVPTLLIYGANDEDTPPDFGRQYQGLIPNAKLELVEDATHFVHHDQPQKVSQLIEEFLT